MPLPIFLFLLLIGLTQVQPTWAAPGRKAPTDFEALVEAIDARQEAAALEEEEEVVYQHLWELYQQPMDLNEASAEELQRLGILSDRQLTAFFEHVAKHGPLVSIYELQAIPDWDLDTIALLVPFVYVEELSGANLATPTGIEGRGPTHSYWLSRYERTLERKAGYLPNKKSQQVPYVGTPDAWTTRLRIQHWQGMDIGFVGRKGAGEAFAWDPVTQRYGLAPCRFHVGMHNKQRLKTCVIGDYAIGYGQGLVLHTGWGMNKSSETIQVMRIYNKGVRPHQALYQSAFRGVATTWEWPHWELTTYYSYVDLAGKVEYSVSSGAPFVRSVQRGGTYKTRGELARQGQVNEQVMGSTVVYKGAARGAVLGANVLYQHYSLPLYPKAHKDCNPRAFRGQKHVNGSLFYQYLWHNFHFFGEGAIAKSGGKAAVVGVIASLSRYVDATVLGRHYDPHFHGPFGQGFKENTGEAGNERGLYLGTRISPLRRFYLDAYYDYFYFPWCYGQGRAGHSWLTKATYQPAKTALVYFQIKTTRKARRVSKAHNAGQSVAMCLRQRYKLVGRYAWRKSWALRSAVQCHRTQLPSTSTWGYAIAQDVTYRLRQVQLRGRVAWFNAPDFDNRLVFYEPDVLHKGFTLPAYYGQGMRYCFLVCYKPTSLFRLELKYALTWYKKGSQVGRGWEALSGRVRNDVLLQAVLRF